MKVKITWSTGKVEFLDRSDCDTIDQVTNSVFGSQWELAEANGVTVEEATEEEFLSAHAAAEEQAPAEEQAQSDADVVASQQLQHESDTSL